jgi:protein SCO1/2
MAAIEDRLGASIPKGLALQDEAGRQVTLGDCLGEKPVLLAPVDFDCPEHLQRHARQPFRRAGAVRPQARRGVRAPGREHRSERRPSGGYRQRFETATPAHFLAGDATRLIDAMGFRYAYDPDTDQYAHPTAVAALTSLYGYPFETFDLRLALSEAGEGTVGNLADRLWLLCFHYDPKLGTYTPAVLGTLQAGGALIAVLLAGGIIVALRREKRRRP